MKGKIGAVILALVMILGIVGAVICLEKSRQVMLVSCTI